MKIRAGIVSGVAVGLLAASSIARADDEAAHIQNLVEKRAPSVVTIKVVLKTEFKSGGQGSDSESRMELQGVVVDKDGLIMVSNMPFSPSRMMEMFGGGGGGDSEGFGIKMTPTDFKVIFERDDKEYNAFLAATDTKLDLAFLKVEDATDRKMTPIEFTGTASPAIGEQVFSISRMKKGYDYAPYFESARISGSIAKPRKAWMIDGSISGFGLPVYTSSGEVLGVLTTITSGVQDDSRSDAMGFSSMMRMFSGGGGLIRAFIVPGPSVNSVIAQAKKRAVEVAAQRAARKANGGTAAPSKDTTKSKTK